MKDADVRVALEKLGAGWGLDGQILRKTFTFPDYASALAFVNKVGALAEEDQHHPDLTLSYGKVSVELTTHDAGGLSEKDFALATKIEGV